MITTIQNAINDGAKKPQNRNLLIDSITNNYPNSNVDFKQSSKWTRVGVVAKTKSGQTYVAVSVQVGKLA